MDLLAVMQQLKALQMKPNKSPADEAKIRELQAALLKPQPKDPKAGPPRTPTPSRPGVPAAPKAAPPSAPAAPARPMAPAAASRPVAAPANPARPRPPAGVPDADAFKLNVKGLSDEGGEDEPDETDAAKTTHEIGEADIGDARSGGDAFALQVPDDLEKIDLPEDDEGGLRHEVGEEDLGEAEAGDAHHSLKLKEGFAQQVAATAQARAPQQAAPAAAAKPGLAPAPGAVASPGPYLPKGTPLVPDAQYAKLQANDSSVVVQFRDGRLAKGIAGSFLANAPSFTLNQMVPGKPAQPVKLEDVLTVRYIRAYNVSAAASAPFPPGAPPPLAAQGERAKVQLLDGETVIGVALQRKEGAAFFLVPADPKGNVRRLWINAKAIRKYEKV